MDFLKDLLAEKGGDLLQGLVNSGFSQEQAEQFLPEAGTSLASAVSQGASDEKSILNAIDIGALAEKTGLDSSLVNKGLQALLPLVLNQLGGGGLQGLMGAAQKMFK